MHRSVLLTSIQRKTRSGGRLLCTTAFLLHPLTPLVFGSVFLLWEELVVWSFLFYIFEVVIKGPCPQPTSVLCPISEMVTGSVASQAGQ